MPAPSASAPMSATAETCAPVKGNVGAAVAVGVVVAAVGSAAAGVAVLVGVAVAVAVGVAVLVGATAAQAGTVTTLESNVTAPLRANSRPVIEAPVVALTEVNASTVPTNTEFVPSVAELPTCQNTLHAVAPPISATLLVEPVMSVLAAWNTKTALGLP